MPSNKVKRIIAWAVVDNKGDIRPHGVWWNIFNIGYSEDTLDLHRPSDKIIPVTITYSLLKIKRKKKLK